MAPPGWLDVHAHFYLPMTRDQAEDLRRQFHAANFLVDDASNILWDPERVIAYNDSAGVSMQLLSYIPARHEKLRAANDYAREIVRRYPGRFGWLLALPTDDAVVCLGELERVEKADGEGVGFDGFCCSTVYNGVSLGDGRLEALWGELDRREAVVHVHPNAYSPGEYGRPSPLIDVAFDTARVVTDMLYNGVFRRWPRIRFIFAHCGGALPVLSGRLCLLGTEKWVPNPLRLTRAEIEEQLGRLYVDTAATAKTGLAPALKMVGPERCLYGADCGVPCSTARTMDENMADVGVVERECGLAPGTIRENTWRLFPAAAKRAESRAALKVNGQSE